MPDDQQHLHWAFHNLKALNYMVQEDDFCDWTATICFYLGVHVIDAVLYRDKKLHGVCHKRRNQILKFVKSYEMLYRHNRKLSSISSIARYLQDNDGKTIYFHDYMDAGEVKTKVVRHHLKKLMESACNFMSVRQQKDIKSAIRNLP